jgi:hypothetical protein
LHVVFAAQVAIALLGAAVALLVIGRGPRPQGRRAEQDTGEAGQDPGTQAAASARNQQHRRKRHATSPSGADQPAGLRRQIDAIFAGAVPV